jgi:uncharacterized protein (UPF0264 family)
MSIIVAFIGAYTWGTTARPLEPQQAVENPRIQQALQQARQVASELTDKVRGLLFKELEKGGYVGAVRVCSEVAQEIPREFAARTGHDIRRVSLRERNSKDVPDEYERKQLEVFDRLNREKTLENDYFEVVTEQGRDYLRYMKPLIAGPMCITCHGQKERIPPEVKAVLAEKYPDDRATGYDAGDVRGAISVKIALPVESKK